MPPFIDDQVLDATTGNGPLIGVVAGEASGDTLGAGLLRELKKQLPDARFVGIGGPKMLAEGFQTLAPMERLSVMGIVEPLKRLPELLRIRKALKDYFVQHRPAVFIGIDSPDFNLPIEKYLRGYGIKTCHYVCPSVWAWRQSRVKGIRKSVDRVLALLPFEADFLARHQVPATFVGHPLGDSLASLPMDKAGARQWLANAPEAGQKSGAQVDGELVCIMPGSRSSELGFLSDVFLQTAQRCLLSRPDLQFVLPAASEALHELLKQRLAGADMQALRERLTLVNGHSLNCMIASDVVLLASGTATLEAALVGRPMVVAYRLAPLTYTIASRMVKVEHVALPNLLTEKPLVPEFIQHEANPENLAGAIIHWLDDHEACQELVDSFAQLRTKLARNADSTAAQAVLELCGYDSNNAN